MFYQYGRRAINSSPQLHLRRVITLAHLKRQSLRFTQTKYCKHPWPQIFEQGFYPNSKMHPKWGFVGFLLLIFDPEQILNHFWNPKQLRGLVKKFCLLPCNFLVVNGSILKIDMDLLWTFIYTLEKLRIDTMYIFFCRWHRK